MAARKKRRSFQHIMEDQSLQLIRQVLPKEWAIHDYKPDYGIDLVVEIFEYTDDMAKIAETLGELFFVQVKSIQKTEIEKLHVYARGNVEKAKPIYNLKTSHIIDVIKFDIETNELLTIQSMGSGVPVLLFLVSLDLQRIYFVCLNDLIDKVITPTDPKWKEKDTKTIHIPTANEISGDVISLTSLRFYAKRSKLYAAFIKFKYQFDELRYAINNILIQMEQISDSDVPTKMYFWKNYRETLVEEPESTLDTQLNSLVNLLLHFIDILKNLDVWFGTDMWAIIEDCHNQIIKLESMLTAPESDKFEAVKYSEHVWHSLSILSNNYEELCREWFMPTYLSQYLSYPEYPNS